MKRPAFRLTIVLLAAAILLAWGNHFRNGFHFDDSHAVLSNVFIRDLHNIPRFFRDASTSSSLPWNQLYRPLVTLSLAIDYRLGRGYNPFFFHLSTFLFFVGQGALMYLLFRKIFARALPGDAPVPAALFAAAWYLLHPANAETVNYVIARSDSLSTFFVVLAVLLATGAAGPRRQLGVVAGALAILVKPVAAVFPLLLLACELLCRGSDPGEDSAPETSLIPRWRRALIRTAPAFAVTALLLLLVKALSPPGGIPAGASYFEYAITQPLVILHYVVTLFLPLRLSADTDWRPLKTVLDLRFAVGVAGVAALLGLALAAGRRRAWRPVAFGLWWFLIALVPTSFGFPLAEVMNDHRVFFPYVGLVMAVTWAAALLLHRLRVAQPRPWIGPVAAAAAVAVLCGYAYGTHRRNEVWRTDETLWRDVTEKSPGNGRGWTNYGQALMAKGDYPAAERAFLKALQLIPEHPYLHFSLGVLLSITGRRAEAETSFRRALALGAGNPEPYYYYGRFLVGENRAAEAVPLLRRALVLSPAHLEARHLLMTAYARLGNHAQLADLARETLRIAPGDAAAQSALAKVK